MKILKNRIYNLLDSQQPFEQAGFRKNFSTMDHIQTLNQLLEKANEFNIDLAIMFIDFNKAFDSLYHDKIWIALAQQGIPKDIIKILKNFYEKSITRIKLDKESEWFPINRGVKQGDPLSPNIFNAVLEHIFKQMNWTGKGIKIKFRNFNLYQFKYLNNLRFADDIAIIAKSEAELKSMAEDLRRESWKVSTKLDNKSGKNKNI